MTPDPPPTPESEPEFKPPDLSKWWLALPDVPTVELTPEELQARRDEMAPWEFKQLDFCREQEQRILAMLRDRVLSKTDRKHLLRVFATARALRWR